MVKFRNWGQSLDKLKVMFEESHEESQNATGGTLVSKTSDIRDEYRNYNLNNFCGTAFIGKTQNRIK